MERALFRHRLFRLSLLIFLPSLLLMSCDNRPTAMVNVKANFDYCQLNYAIGIHSDGNPVNTIAQLDGASGEVESEIGCGIDEFEFAFITDPLVSKIEFDLGEGEITAFVPLDGKTQAPPPFIVDSPGFQSLEVEVTFPDGKQPPLKGFIKVK